MPAREWITRPAADRRALEAQGWRYHGDAVGATRQGRPLALVIMWRALVGEDAEAA